MEKRSEKEGMAERNHYVLNPTSRITHLKGLSVTGIDGDNIDGDNSLQLQWRLGMGKERSVRKRTRLPRGKEETETDCKNVESSTRADSEEDSNTVEL
ncbi:hypothetical protein llap_7175 [Limosa lapponica baueri]|uniref:Uncharacterized protein n=1 Tax=Limosa lapponica baueri TaxID=1758121 RepID=A0A2I0U8Y6_LIMLA|nr:hypothetical protein llap_7175 [Limosa lapponica baueri]